MGKAAKLSAARGRMNAGGKAIAGATARAQGPATKADQPKCGGRGSQRSKGGGSKSAPLNTNPQVKSEGLKRYSK